MVWGWKLVTFVFLKFNSGTQFLLSCCDQGHSGFMRRISPGIYFVVLFFCCRAIISCDFLSVGINTVFSKRLPAKHRIVPAAGECHFLLPIFIWQRAAV